MSMRKFTLGKILKHLKDEPRKQIVAIVERAAQEKGVEVVDLEVVRRDTTAGADFLKAAPKFEGEPTIEKGSRVFPIIVSTRQMDRDDEIVMPKGLNMKDWAKSGVVITAHDYNKLPSAKAVWVGVNDFGVKMHFEAAPTDDGDKLFALSQFMPLTASIGMGSGEFLRAGTPEFEKATKKMLRDWPEFSDKTLEGLRGIIAKATLFEVSIVAVPANPNAVQTALAKSALSDDDKGLIRKTLDISEEPWPTGPNADSDDIYAENVALKSEVRDLKAKVDQLITEKAVPSPEPKPKPAEKRSVEVVQKRTVEIVKQTNVTRHVELAIDIGRGRV
jgi:hypothetical protein